MQVYSPRNESELDSTIEMIQKSESTLKKGCGFKVMQFVWSFKEYRTIYSTLRYANLLESIVYVPRTQLVEVEATKENIYYENA